MSRIAPHPAVRPLLWAVLLLAAGLLGPALAPAAETQAASAAPGWRLVLRDAAVVRGERVTLGQIARVEGEMPPGAWEELSATELWEAPDRPGRPVTLSRRQLEGLLARYVPDVAQACVLPTRLSYQLGGKVYDDQALTRLVVEFLTQRAKGMGDVEVKDVRVPEAVFLDTDYDRLEMGLSGELAPGRVSLRFRVVASDGRILQRSAASAFLNVWQAVPCAARNLGKLEEITPDKVTFKRKNLAYMGPVWDGKSGPMRTVRSLGRGAPLLSGYLEAAPLIARGETVTLVYEGPTLRLAVKAEALGDARFGDTVEVRNLQSNKTVIATAVDEHTVVIR
ncbi:MAG: flagellar basal body P-ring formation chaperone FlgA [Desulfovibrionaceae bacterium]